MLAKAKQVGETKRPYWSKLDTLYYKMAALQTQLDFFKLPDRQNDETKQCQQVAEPLPQTDQLVVLGTAFLEHSEVMVQPKSTKSQTVQITHSQVALSWTLSC